MIFKLDQIYLTEADATGLPFICMSKTGLYFLVQAESLPESIEALESYSDSMMLELLADEEWLQPRDEE